MTAAALVPFPAAGLPPGAAELAVGWRSVDPWEPLGLVLPARLRREAAGALGALGWQARGELQQLPALRIGVPVAAEQVLAAGAVTLFVRHLAWGALEGRGLADAQAAAEAELGPLATRLIRERDLVALGDLLQACAKPATVASSRWVRFCVLRLGADPGPLLALLRADRVEPGLTPLARAGLGAALGSQAGPWADAELEDRLVELCLAAPGPVGAGTAARPQAVPRLQLPPEAAGLVQSLQAAARGLSAAPSGLALEARLRDVAAAVAGDLPAVERLGPAGTPASLRLTLLVSWALAGLDEALRRRLWRRLVANADPSELAANQVEGLFPELAGLDRLLVSCAAAPDLPEQVQRRLIELELEPPALIEGERELARGAVTKLSAATRARLGQLELWLAAGRPEAVPLARQVLARAAEDQDALEAPVVGTALRVLVEAGQEPFPALPFARTTGPVWSLLLRWHQLRWQVAPGQAGCLPEALLERLVGRSPSGLVPGPGTLELDPHLLASVLGQLLTVDAALDVLAAAVPPVGGAVLLPIRARAGGACDGLLLEPGRPPRPVVAWVEAQPGSAVESLRALAGATSSADDASAAERNHTALELPEVVLTARFPEGPRRCLVGPRLVGRPLGHEPTRVPALCRLVHAAHQLGLALAVTPRRAARVRPDGGLGLAELDPSPLWQPQARSAAQGRDRAALRELVLQAGGEPQGEDPREWAGQLEAALRSSGPFVTDLGDPRGESRAFLLDVLPGRGPHTAAALGALLPPRLADLWDLPHLQELLRDVREEAWCDPELLVGGGEVGLSLARAEDP